MPVYEYRCESCGERFEKLVRSIHQEPPEVHCPACQGTEVRRLISAPVVHSSGEGGGDAAAEETPAPKPPVFGRKELNEALKKKS
jgi:putative FmdB family regulatory protein